MALPDGAYDPLFRRDLDPFWQQVDPYRNPVRESDIEFLAGLDLNPLASARADLQLTVPPLDGGAMSLQAPALGEPAEGPPSGPGPRATGASTSARKARSSAGASAAAAAAAASARVVDEAEEQQTRLDSFPMTTRLVAALLDEGNGASVSATPLGKKSSVTIPPLPGLGNDGSSNIWPVDAFFHGVGESEATRSHQKVVEERVSMELCAVGLVDSDNENELVRELRLEQWRLRDLKTANRTRKNAILQKVYGVELKQQAKRREIKQGNDELEYLYLDRMIKKAKKNKRAKSKYQRLANQWFPYLKYRKDGTIGVEMPSDPKAPVSSGTGIGIPSMAGPAAANSSGATSKGKGSKKAKSKRPPPRDPVPSTPVSGGPPPSAEEKPAVEAVEASPPGQFPVPENAGENIKIIVGAINRAGGQAQVEYIIDEFLKAFPGLSAESARRRVVTSLTLTKKIIKFKKHPNGDFSPMHA